MGATATADNVGGGAAVRRRRGRDERGSLVVDHRVESLFSNSILLSAMMMLMRCVVGRLGSWLFFLIPVAVAVPSAAVSVAAAWAWRWACFCLCPLCFANCRSRRVCIHRS